MLSMFLRNGFCSSRHCITVGIERLFSLAISSMVLADSRNMPRTALMQLVEKVLEGSALVGATAVLLSMHVFYVTERAMGRGRARSTGHCAHKSGM